MMFQIIQENSTASWVFTVVPGYHGFLLAILPPGAFIALGMLIAARNWLILRADRKLKGAKTGGIPVDGGAPVAHQG